MLAAIKLKVSGSKKKVNKNTCEISSIKRVTRKFLDVLLCSRAKQRQRNVAESVLHLQSCFFDLSFFTVLLPSPLKVMLHGKIRNDDFLRNTVLQCWNNVATMLR